MSKAKEKYREVEGSGVKLTAAEMLGLVNAQLQERLSKTQLEKFTLREQLLLIQQKQQLAELRMKKVSCERSIEAAQKDYNDKVSSIGIRLGINPDDYIFDEEGYGTVQEFKDTDCEEARPSK